MAPRSPFATITTEGGLLSSDLLARLARQPNSLSGTSPDDYHLVSGRRLRDAINRSWTELQGAWTTFATELAKLPAGERATTVTRERWLLPLFAELGFGRLQRASAITIAGREYPISHLWGAVPIHLLGADVELDRRTKGVAGAASAAPSSMVQELLNRSEDHLWAILSNGRRLRLLRDNTSLTRASYVEFDLEAMFAGQVFTDFAVLWMVCHESRFEADQPEQCWLERWIGEARQQGVRALDTLRTGFEKAITVLGGGFIAQPANAELRERLRDGKLSVEDYHHQVLRLVYRLVFLLVAEDRDLFHPPATSDQARQHYARYYSLGRIRDHARRHRGTRHSDLFESLGPVFVALGANGIAKIGVPALGSFLWSPDACPDLDTAALSNNDLLEAVRHLAYTEQDRALQRVDFANLGPEELGSVYESLLELHPRVETDAARFELYTVAGNERKSTGSYYTPTSLIAALLDTALDPLLDEAEGSPDPQAAILSIKVLDPACGSGHFLTAAARRIATRLAAVQTGELNPTPEAVRHALRQVVGRCIYGIDLNPMATELAKVNLWLDAVEPGLPLSFLDHHVVWGNGLIGTNPRLIADGIPDEAFKPIEGDDKPTAAARKKTNTAERRQRNQGLLALGDSALSAAGYLADAVRAIDAEDDTTVEGIRRKQQRWAELQAARETQLATLVADTWCAAFFVPKTPEYAAITDQTLRAIAGDRTDSPDVIAHVTDLSAHYRFLHPHLAFPDVFVADPEMQAGWEGGFDLVLGNPPWDTLNPEVKSFFGAYEPAIRSASKAEQDLMVTELLEIPEVAARWNRYQRDLYSSVHFMKLSGRYRLFAQGHLGKGGFNAYRMFVETAMQLTRPGGSAAQVVPSGFYGGANASAIRRELYEYWQLSHLLGFINSGEHWFTSVDATTRFAAYVARKGGATKSFEAAFELRSSADLARALAGDTTTLVVSDIRDQSPDALAIPEVTSAVDAALGSRMSTGWPLLGDQTADPPFRQFLQAEVNMGTDRDLFGDFAEGLPVYEGRMVDQFDHRAKAYRSGRGRSAVWEALPFGDSRKAIAPQWRLPPEKIPRKLGNRVWRYRVGWCDVTAPRNERSLIAALIPPNVICGHSLPTLTFPDDFEWAYMPWLAFANSVCLDFLARKRVALHMSMTALDTLPFPRLPIDHPVIDRLGRVALRLTCTAPEMTAYWNAMAHYGWCEPVPEDAAPPSFVDPDLRAAARAEIDAVVAREMFGLSADELAGIFDTFPVLRRREEKTYGEFRTKRLVLEWYDKL
jgi:hypothetical protein